MTTTDTKTVTKPRKKRAPAAASRITTKMEFIDPQQAINLVENSNPRNRKVDRGNVAKLAAQMEAGTWLPGVAIIKFDPKGNLVDGQHTLYAIEKSGEGQWLTVMRGVPGQALDVINTGKSMTLTDHPDIKDLPNRSTISALVPFIYKHKAGLVGQQLFGGIQNYSASMTGSMTDLLKTFKDNQTVIVQYAALGSRVSRSIPVTASTIAQAAYLFYALDETGADEFFETLASGAGLAKDSPIYILRERIITDLSNKNQTKQPKWLVLAYIIKAWNYYQHGTPVKRLKFSPRVEEYPVPVAPLDNDDEN